MIFAFELGWKKPQDIPDNWELDLVRAFFKEMKKHQCFELPTSNDKNTIKGCVMHPKDYIKLLSIIEDMEKEKNVSDSMRINISALRGLLKLNND
jgi:hypothetical protein